MNKVLIIEDDKEIAQIEKDYLHKEGFDVIHVITGGEGLKQFSENSPDLVVLDLNLPGVNGYDVCRQIREKSGVPIIMVTAKTKEIDELLGLEVGADDYVKKPFSPRILVSRVKALLRRPSIDDVSEVLKLGDLEIDLERRTLRKGSSLLNLTTIQFDILLRLAQSPGKVFSRDALMDEAYDKGDLVDIFDRTIDSHIKNIRKVIEEDSKKPRYIITVRGIGYKFNEEI